MRFSNVFSSASRRRRTSEGDCWTDGTIMAISSERKGQAISLVLGWSDVKAAERVEVWKMRLLGAREMIKLRVTSFPCADQFRACADYCEHPSANSVSCCLIILRFGSSSISTLGFEDRVKLRCYLNGRLHQLRDHTCRHDRSCLKEIAVRELMHPAHGG
jgi:hypothetical protein